MTVAMRFGFLPLLIASSAAADPSAEPQRCEVSIARAPADVREAIETWVRAEERCTALEIRVVPTQGGYYLFARDSRGRVRERIVPDAQSAGVLVASWAADDGGPVGEPAPEAAIIEVVPPAQITISAPGAVPAVIADRIVPRRAEAATRWLTVGGSLRVQDGGGGGVRADLDVFARGPWTFGISGAGSRSFSEILSSDGFGTLEAEDVRGLVTVARTSRWDAWELRVGAGLGVVRTTATGYNNAAYPITYTASGVSPTVEGAILLSRRFSERMALGVGPIATYYHQNFDALTFQDTTQEMTFVPLARNQIELSLFAGLRLAL